VRVTRPFSRILLLEAGAGLMRYDTDGGDRAYMFFPEVQLQVQAPLGRVAPYLGFGGGMVIGTISDAADVAPVRSRAASAVRAATPDPGRT